MKSMLFGHPGRFRQHVKDEVNKLGAIDDAAGRESVLRALCVMTMWSGTQHFGMPDWERVVDHAVAQLSCPADPRWDDGGFERATARLPRRFVDEPAEFGVVLRRDPGSLGPDVLDDLISSGLFMWPGT